MLRPGAVHRLIDWVHGLPHRVATKFAVALTGGALLALAATVTLLSLHERREVGRATAEDLRSQGEALAPLLAEIWTRDGEARARDALRAADAASHGALRLVPGHDAPDAAATVSTEADRTVVRVPLALAESAPHVLVLERRTPSVGGALTAALEALLMAAVPLALFAMLAAYALGESLVGGPLRRVAERARRVGQGDLDDRLVVRGSAEICALKESINEMSEALASARALARDEQDRRVEAVSRLRHAERLTTVGTLAAGVAHELGTPLNVILLEARSVERASGDPARVARGAELIRGQAGRVIAIVRQLLDFARRKERATSVVDARDVAASAAAVVQSLAKVRRCLVDVTSGGGDLRLRADAGAIQQVLTNLLVNAFDAMPGGGRVEVRVSRVLPTAGAGDGERAWIAIEVEDDGEGMDESTRARIFEPFFTTKEVGSGTGLGLSVALGIAEDHGGRLEVRAAPVRGTVVSLLLPSAEAPAAADTAPRAELTSAA